jgi:hypothetical protein
VEDILDVTLKGSNLEAFLADWDRCLIHMEKQPSEDLRDALFIKQVKACPKLKTEWDNYYKAEVGSSTRSFEYLYKSAMMVVERERFENARKNVTGKGGTDSMAAPGDSPKGKRKGKGKGSSTGDSTDATDPPWYMENGKDKRAERPCSFLAAGNCRLGKDCPWKHGKPSKKIDVAAAPTGDSTKKPGGRRPCHSFKDTGKCSFGDACQFSHDLSNKKKKSDDKSGKGDKKREKDGKKSSGKKEDGKKKKKGRPGAVAEVASSESEKESASDSDLSSYEESSSD